MGHGRTAPFRTIEQLELATADRVAWFNTARLHSSLNYLTPTVAAGTNLWFGGSGRRAASRPGGKDPVDVPGSRNRPRLTVLSAAKGDAMTMYRAIFNEQVIAESSDIEVVEGNVYFPPAALRAEFLHRTRAKSLCPWKGIASYYTVEVDGTADRNAAWTYRHPSPLARRIKDHVAFWGTVQVTEL